MKKSTWIITAGLVMAFLAGNLWAEEITNWKDIYFGTNYFKSSHGLRLTTLDATWDETGLQSIQYRITPRRGDFYFVDLYVVSKIDGKDVTVYRRSDHEKMEILLGVFVLDKGKFPKKHFEDRLYFTPPLAKAVGPNTSIWWVVTAANATGENPTYYVIWDLSKNTVDWYHAKDKPVPGAQSAAPPAPAAPTPETPPSPPPPETPK